MTIDWNEAAVGLKRDVGEHGGFLTMQRDTLRERFGIGRLAERITQDLLATLDQHGMIVFPHPYYMQGTSLRVYDVESEIGKIALAVVNPQDVPERALVDVVKLYARANAGKDRRSDDVPWLLALDVFLQLVIGRPPEGWEDLDDDREPYQLDRGPRREPRVAGRHRPCDGDHPHRRRRMRVPPARAAVGGRAAGARRHRLRRPRESRKTSSTGCSARRPSTCSEGRRSRRATWNLAASGSAIAARHKETSDGCVEGRRSGRARERCVARGRRRATSSRRSPASGTRTSPGAGRPAS